jgi:hypothetical protein
MNREEVIKLAQKAGFDPHDMSDDFTCNLVDIERFAALVADAERNKLADWMIERGYATGHGDSTEGLLKELGWQIEERIKNEREACAKVVEDYCGAWDDEGYALAAAIRARGDK